MRRSARHVEVDFAELSDAGLDPTKQVNEDCSAFAETALGHLAVVCDGMGGHVSGREASFAAVRTILDRVQAAPPDTPATACLRAAIAAAHQAVRALGAGGPDQGRPGSTCVAGLIADGTLSLAHVGDSRALLVRQGETTRLTRDHSLVQEMMSAGLLTPEQAAVHPDANKITRALGIGADLEVESSPEPVPLQRDDVIILASDGLTDLVSEVELGAIVQSRLKLGPAVICQALIELVHQRGAHDNATVQLIRILQSPGGTLRPPAPPGSPPPQTGSPQRKLAGLAATVPGGEPRAHGPGRTEPDGSRMGPARVHPTVIEGEEHPRDASDTLPGTAPAHAYRTHPGVAAARRSRPWLGLILLLAVLGVVGALAGGVSIWWATLGPSPDADPPPLPSTSEALPDKPTVLVPELVPEDEPEGARDSGPEPAGSTLSPRPAPSATVPRDNPLRPSSK